MTVEGLPEVSFTHTSPMQCWDSVRDRVNEEIAKQISFGKSGLPDFLSCNSLNGLEMFGFLSSPIIKVDFYDIHSIYFCETWSLQVTS